MSFDLTKVRSRHVPEAHWSTHKHVTWSTRCPPPVGDVSVGDVVHKYGQSFIWTEQHQDAAQLMPTRQCGDALADDVVAGLAPSAAADLLPLIEGVMHNQSSDSALSALADDVGTVPEWVDWDKIGAGQQVFAKYAPGCGMSLFYISLVGGFSAPLITRVLRATGYLTAQPRDVMRRLMDTGSMITACLGPSEASSAMRPLGEGWRACLRVRILHTKVRQRLLQSDGWDSAEWGVPINQMDLTTTLLAFSYNVIMGLELLLGREIPLQEQEDYLHLWRYIGFLLGVDEDLNPCTSVKRAKCALESSIMCILEADTDSVAVATHLLGAPGPFGRERRHRLCRRMMGRGLADALQLPGGITSWRDWWCEVAVSAELRTVRLYLRACQWPLLGGLLHRLHWYTIRKLELMKERNRKQSKEHTDSSVPGFSFGLVFEPSTAKLSTRCPMLRAFDGALDTQKPAGPHVVDGDITVEDCVRAGGLVTMPTPLHQDELDKSRFGWVRLACVVASLLWSVKVASSYGLSKRGRS